ncbi:MAG TPA: histidine kinase [Chitinophagaceae bacterium]|nr:histidine kinase [Chitinophagaceae bacterium]
MYRFLLYIFLLPCVVAAWFPLEAITQLPDYQLSAVIQQEGLKTSDIRQMARDRTGILWLVSQTNVQRFDGRHARQFPFNETVDKVYIDSSNRKWVITRQHIYLFKNLFHGFKEIPFDSAGESPLIHLYQNGKGSVFAARSNGHYIFNDSLQLFQKTVAPVFAGNIRYTRFAGETAQAIFFGTADSLYRYHYGKKQLSAIAVRPAASTIVLNDSVLFVSTTSFQTTYYNILTGEKQVLYTTNKNNPLERHLNLFKSIALDDVRYLLCSNKGFLEYNGLTRVFSKPVFYYQGRLLENQSSARYLYKDPDGIIFTNHADGILFMPGKRVPIQYIRNFNDGNSTLPNNDVRHFAEDEKGYIWLATSNGIARLNMETGGLKVYSLLGQENAVDFPSYRQLFCDAQYLWIGTAGNGVWLMDKQTEKFIRPRFPNTAEGEKTARAFASTYVWKILKLQDGRFFIAGGGRHFIVHPGTLLTEMVSFTSAAYISRSAIQDSAGRIWHGTTRGLSCMDNRFNTYFLIRDSFPDKRIAAFCEWKKNRMLVGTRGLYEIEVRDGAILSFQKKAGIPTDRFIYCMKQDGDGIVWMGTDDGIYRYNPLTDRADYFDQSDHVQSETFNSDAALLSSKGYMFMGGRNGLNYFKPSLISSPADQLEPVIDRFIITGDDSSYHLLPPPYKLSYNNRNIDFAISAPTLKKPFRVQYRYRLNEEGDEWVYTGFNNQVRINGLKPGKYSLQVSASFDGTTWYDGQNNLSFIIQKPWWQSWWFRLLCLAILVSAGLAFSRYRQKRQEANEMKRAIEYFAHSGYEHSSTEDILWDIARNCISRLNFEDCVIYLVDEKRNMLVQKAAYGDKSPRDFEIANPIEIPMGQGISGFVAETGKSLIVGDTSKDKRYIVDDEKRASELTVPIIHEGKVIGVIDSEHHRKNFFQKRHLATLETIASLCSAKISTTLAMEAARKAETELAELNNKIIESRFQNLRLQMNPHFLFNILTTIQYLIVSGQTTKASNYLNIFSGFLRSILHYAEDPVVSLQEELRILELYIELESLCMDESFSWEVEVDSGIDTEETLFPFMLLQPFVENAIHHGLVQKIGEKRFTIRIIEQDEDYLSCVIEDNGIGREKAMQINGRNLSSVIYKSKGIDIVKQRLELMEQATTRKNGVRIEDLYNNGEPAGTRVHITLSYNNKEEL